MSADRETLAAMIAAMFGGQQQQEHITYNTHTQVWVPFMQGIGLLGSVGAILGGFAAIGMGLFWTAQQFTAIMDRLLVSASIATVGMLLLTVERALRRRLETAEIWHTVAGFLARVALLMLGLDLVYWLSEAWQWQQTVVFVAGLGGILAGGLLTWRFVNELWNPLYPRSPWASLVERFLGAVAGEQEVVRELVPYPVFLNENGRPRAADPLPEEPHILSPDFADLLAFVELAAFHGLSRDNLVVAPRHKLASGQRLTRTVYDHYIEALAQWRIIERGEGGRSHTWIMEPEAAQRLLREVAALAEPGRQQLK